MKRLARWCWSVDVAVHRACQRARGNRPFLLGGDCRRCAACCEAPAIHAPSLLFHLPRIRAAFLAWQRVVNGFHLVEARPWGHLFVFRCTHFDRETRSCDSYGSRPGICRDYPRLILFQPQPEFLAGCGYRAVSPNAKGLLKALEGRGLSPEAKAALRTGLYLDE